MQYDDSFNKRKVWKHVYSFEYNVSCFFLYIAKLSLLYICYKCNYI